MLRRSRCALIFSLKNYKRHDKVGYSPICYIGSKIGWVSMRAIYMLIDLEVILENFRKYYYTVHTYQ